MEVRNGPDGRPQVMVCGAAREVARERQIGEILVSISHCRTYATAYALAPGRPAAADEGADQPPRVMSGSPPVCSRIADRPSIEITYRRRR